LRRNAYRDKPSHEQAAYADRIQFEPDFLYHELLALVSDPSHRRKFDVKYTPPLEAEPGEIVEGFRKARGLETQPGLNALPLVEDMVALISLNPQEEITLARDRESLRVQHVLPENGLLIGVCWYGVERSTSNGYFRWVNTDAQLLVTKPDGGPKLLSMHVWPGHANEGKAITVSLVTQDGATLGETAIDHGQTLEFSIRPPPCESVTYFLRVTNSLNRPLPDDPRILNLGVSNLRLAPSEPDP
jgi:hypothetical protein